MPLPNPLITASPDRLGGTPVFAGTRVPVQTLFDFIEDGAPLSEFLTSFPNVSREHAQAVLRASRAAVLLRTIEEEAYRAAPAELAAIDEALGEVERGERADPADVEAAFARFRR